MELPRTEPIPSFHDGSFDGVWIPADNMAHLFLTTVEHKRFTIVLEGVKAMHLENVRQGNIVFGMNLIGTDQLTESHIELLYELSNIARDQQIATLLASARQGGLRMLEMTTSYGAEGVVLFKGIELLDGQAMINSMPADPLWRG
jgi:hypothetical protein